MKLWPILLGVGVVGGGIAIAVALGGSKGAENCVQVEADAGAQARVNAAKSSFNGFGPDSDALELMRSIARAAWPWCSWNDSDITVIKDPKSGATISWSQVVALLRGKTVGDAMTDPTIMSVLNPQMGASSVMSVGTFFSDIAGAMPA